MADRSVPLGLVALLLTTAACAPPATDSDASANGAAISDIGDAEIADEKRTEDWLAYGRTHSETRFSPLTAINDGTVTDLGVAWYRDLPDDVGLVSTPLVVDRILYFTGTMNIIRAVDATTGNLIWEYDPDVAGHIGDDRQVGWVHNRGISFYEGKIFAATWDGRLFALDAKTGELHWMVRTFDKDKPLYITGAPKTFNGKVLIGNGGTEVGRARGFVTAFDADTGEEAWKFYIVPGNPADGFENEALAMAADILERSLVGARRWRQCLARFYLRSGIQYGLHRHRQWRTVEPAYPKSGRWRQPVPVFNRCA